MGSFNLNNLFSRFNFKAEISEMDEAEITATTTYEFGADSEVQRREYKGRLVKGKSREETERVAERVRRISVDVLAVQEVEDIDALRAFNRDFLGSMYEHVVLVEGNDPRLIDVGVLSRYPFGQVTSWQALRHPDDMTRRVFGRDCAEVEILEPGRQRPLFTLFNNHLKSHYVDWRSPDPEAARAANDTRRRRQVETIVEILGRRPRSEGRYVVLGDMNDPPNASCLAPLVESGFVVDALTDPEETRPPKADDPMPTTTAWSHRFKPSGEPARYELYDHVWLSPALADRQVSAHVDRRTRHSGDGSDHDPVWVVID